MLASRWRRVGVSMWVGAAYDALFGLLILLAHEPAARLLGLPLPGELAYFRLIGVLLLLLAALYALAGARAERYQGIVVVAAVGRFAGFLYFAAVVAGGGAPAFGALALADLGLAVTHALLLVGARRAEGPHGVHARP